MRRGKPLEEKTRLPPRVREALDATGLEWSVHSCSTGWKIRLGGRMIQTMPATRHIRPDYERAIIAGIRRHVRSAEQCQEVTTSHTSPSRPSASRAGAGAT